MSIAFDQLSDLGKMIVDSKKDIEAYETTLKQKKATHQALENKFLAHLNEAGVDKFFIPGYGTAYVYRRFSYKVPKGADRTKFFDYLKQKGIYEDLVTVNSQTLNSWAKKELEVAQDEGHKEFEIPGLGAPSMFESLGLRK